VATYVLIHGAGSDSWYWHRVTPLLRAAGHEVVAVDLPVDDDRAGLAEYAEVTVAAIGSHSDLVLVAQSMGGFTAPLVCGQLPVRLVVLLNAMIPRPGEPPGEWWGNTGHAEAMAENAEREGFGPVDLDDAPTLFLHDLASDIAAESINHVRAQSGKPFEEPWPLAAWPDVPTRVLIGREDRLFPAEFQRRVAQERLGVTPEEMPGGHLCALSQPYELVERLETYRTGLADR
jgi:pimeloyl-ACP methyl ester carboxylesterase